MLDIGWPELMVIGVLTVIVVGPKELPRVLRTVMGLVRKVRTMAGEFQSSVEDIAREADMDDIKKNLADAAPDELTSKTGGLPKIDDLLDPDGDVSNSMKDMDKDVKAVQAADAKKEK